MNSELATPEFTVPTVTEQELARVHQELNYLLVLQDTVVDPLPMPEREE